MSSLPIKSNISLEQDSTDDKITMATGSSTTFTEKKKHYKNLNKQFMLITTHLPSDAMMLVKFFVNHK